MTQATLTYAVVTPARNEAENLSRLAEAMVAQTIKPVCWVIVDNGSTDDTPTVASELMAAHSWIRMMTAPGEATPTRGGPIVAAFITGLEGVGEICDVIVKLDADVSFEPDHFERLLAEFSADPTLGIASSTCWEKDDAGSWRAQHVARSHVRGAVRAYRHDCLDQVMPLERRMGWDTIDEVKAQLNGWSVRSIDELAFLHHRETGERDGGHRSWESQGELAWYLDYRVPYLILRTAFRAVHNPGALAMLYGWGRSGIRREPRYPDRDVRRFLRSQQRLVKLPVRAREALGRPENTEGST